MDLASNCTELISPGLGILGSYENDEALIFSVSPRYMPVQRSSFPKSLMKVKSVVCTFAVQPFGRSAAHPAGCHQWASVQFSVYACVVS